MFEVSIGQSSSESPFNCDIEVQCLSKIRGDCELVSPLELRVKDFV